VIGLFLFGAGTIGFVFVLVPRNLAEGLDSSSLQPLQPIGEVEMSNWRSAGDTAPWALHLDGFIGAQKPSRIVNKRKKKTCCAHIPFTS
jgi:hypothetical protein